MIYYSSAAPAENTLIHYIQYKNTNHMWEDIEPEILDICGNSLDLLPMLPKSCWSLEIILVFLIAQVFPNMQISLKIYQICRWCYFKTKTCLMSPFSHLWFTGKSNQTSLNCFSPNNFLWVWIFKDISENHKVFLFCDSITNLLYHLHLNCALVVQICLKLSTFPSSLCYCLSVMVWR